MKQSYRHGDVDIIAISKPSNLKEVEFTGEYVLAYGEVTGHTHRLVAIKDAVKMYKNEQGELILEVLGEAMLKHEEHKQIDLTPGWYKVGNEREYDWWSLSTRKVID